MAGSFRFWLLKFPSHAMRGECLNVGLLLESEGRLQVRIGRRLDKIRAISAALDPSDVEEEIASLPNLLRKVELDSISDRICSSSFLVSEFRGSIAPGSADLVEHYISDLMARYVDPEPARAKAVRKRHTKLRQDIRNAFKSERILAKPSEGLDSHRVLYRHQLSEGVVADFVLRNGAMHVVESVDATSDTISLQKCIYEIALSTLTFEHARINFGNITVRPRLIYTASKEFERALSPSLYAAEHQGAEIINWASTEERSTFLDAMAALAELPSSDKANHTLFHASNLPVRKLN